MYIGGMGGTDNNVGTYRHSCCSFSDSIYHSVLEIRDIDDGPIAATTLSQIWTRLEGVDYIF
jgi:hypothetical protein